ncbi:hypothetical protein EAS61_07400 [Bradyrhizobium zhanjiangense]|uniref:Uncharacterized protein n=1 Tax=Bradyrhizobium zhanjiangense TaxID=1325107 RepID=A0A4Q0QWE1_9BRAD|nr:hypothetical protein EAS61_07400 [Bradyrhizobium zhanjiangense]
MRERVPPRWEIVSVLWKKSPSGENPHPALRADLSRKRERLQRAGGYTASLKPPVATGSRRTPDNTCPSCDRHRR